MSAESVIDGSERWHVEHGSMLDVLPSLPENSFDSCVCDPPYHLTSASRNGSSRTNDPESPFGRHAIGSKGFMGRVWDGGDVALRPETWAHVLRVLKPGAHLLAFGGTRTFHRIACAIEDAGFEIRDSIGLMAWMHGTGFPKSKDLGGGVGTALKPAWEPIIVARKPFAGTTTENYAQHGTGGFNVDACRIRYGSDEDKAAAAAAAAAAQRACHDQNKGRTAYGDFNNGPASLAPYLDSMDGGRWPPNVACIHHPECRRAGTRRVVAAPTWDTPNRDTEESAFTGAEISTVRHAAADGTEEVPVWNCVEGCPVLELDRQSRQLTSGFMPAGTTRGTRTGYSGHMPHQTAKDTIADSGAASRFFPQFVWDPQLDDVTPFLYQAKPARSERDAGLEAFNPKSAAEATHSKDGQARLNSPRTGAGRTGGARNTHPTVKSTDLLRWLVRLVTPPKGIVIDPFSGSGSCGIAAMLEGLRYFGVELNNSEEEPFVSIARARIAWVIGGGYVPTATAVDAATPTTGPAQRSLF